MKYTYGKTAAHRKGSIGIANLNGNNEYILIAAGPVPQSNLAIALIDDGPVTINAHIAPLILEDAYIEPVISIGSLVFGEVGRPVGSLVLAECRELVFRSRSDEQFVDIASGAVSHLHFIDAPHTLEWRIMLRNEDQSTTELRRFKFSA